MILRAWLCCKITGQPFRSFATGVYYVACRWEHGTIASSGGLLVNTANGSPSHHFTCSSSCTEPQECRCERSEQQQTCWWLKMKSYKCGVFHWSYLSLTDDMSEQVDMLYIKIWLHCYSCCTVCTFSRIGMHPTMQCTEVPETLTHKLRAEQYICVSAIGRELLSHGKVLFWAVDKPSSGFW